MADGIKTPRVKIMLRKHGDDFHNVSSVEVSAFDMSEYVDALRMIYQGRADYMVVEPVVVLQTYF